VTDVLAAGGLRWGSVGPLVLTSLAIMGSPGPTTISLVAGGSAYGTRACLPYLAGVIAGTMAVLVAVATGITAALLAVPALGSVLLAISAVYILWLAYHIATAPPLSRRAAGAAPLTLGSGALLGVANPKAWVAIAAVFAGSTLADGAVVDAGAKLAVLSLMIVVIHVGWLGIGIPLAPLLRDPRRARVINALLALTLVGATMLAVLE
jgi:threonine/homoserine/homoserine lactone efflux protein